jgi:hypothetical protein
MAVPCKPYEAVRLGKGLRSIAHQRPAHGRPNSGVISARQLTLVFVTLFPRKRLHALRAFSINEY